MDGKHPVVLGPPVIHSEKDYFLYGSFITRMCSFRSNIRASYSIKINLDTAIYNEISSQLHRAMLPFRSHYLEKCEKQKIKTMADIYGYHYGAIQELSLGTDPPSKPRHSIFFCPPGTEYLNKSP